MMINVFGEGSTKGMVIIFSIAGILLLNTCHTIYTLHKLFPDRSMTDKRWYLSITGAVLHLLVVGAMIYIIIKSLPFRDMDIESIFTFSLFNLMTAVGIYTSLLQFRLDSYLVKNSHKEISLLIQSIGEL